MIISVFYNIPYTPVDDFLKRFKKIKKRKQIKK